MPTLHEHVSTAASLGTHRVAFHLIGDDIDIQPMSQPLTQRLLKYTGAGQYKVVWFRIHGGIILVVAGQRVALPLVRSFLAGYAGDFAEAKELYAGTGTKAFMNIVEPFYEHVDLSGRSYGATR